MQPKRHRHNGLVHHLGLVLVAPITWRGNAIIEYERRTLCLWMVRKPPFVVNQIWDILTNPPPLFDNGKKGPVIPKDGSPRLLHWCSNT